MDEEVIQDLYNRAVSKGYKKTQQEFVTLLHSDNEVLNDMYSYVQSKGYRKDINEFKTLVGFNGSVDVKKKDETLPQSGQPSEVVGQPSTGTPAMESDLTLQSQTSTDLVSPLDGSTLALEEEKVPKQSSDYQSMISMAAEEIENDDDRYKVKAIGKKASAPRPNISLEEYADISTKLPVYKGDPNKVFKPEQSYPQGVIDAADQLGMTPEDYLDFDKRLKRQEEIRADEKAIEAINREKKNLEIENAYVKDISKTYGISEEEAKNNLPFFALKNTFSDPEGRSLGIESFDPDDVLNLRQQLAEKAINTSGTNLKEKAFEKLINANDGDVMSAEKVFDQKMEDIGSMFLSDQEKEIKKLKESILDLESNPNITPEEKRKIETKKGELTKFMREGLLGYTKLFDPSTGKFVSSDEASEDVISFNNEVNNKIKSYENTDLGKLKKYRDDIYFNYQAFVLDFMLNQKPTGLSGLNIETYANRYGIKTYDETTGRYKSPTELLDMFTKEQKKQMALEQYKSPFNFHGWDIGGTGDMSQAFKIMNSDIFPDDVTKKAQEILADYVSVNRAINLNEDPGSVIESYGLGRVLTYAGKGLKESLGGVSENAEVVADRAIENIQKAGFDLTLQQQDAIRQDMPQKVGEAVGASIVPMAEIMVNLALFNKAAGAAKIPQLIKTISGGNKIAEFGLDLAYEMASQGAAFEMAGEEFISGAGEGFGQFLVDAALKKLKIDNRALSIISKSVGGALSETAAEYTGQFVDELSKKNVGFDKAVERTFGKTPEDAMEKFALTYLVSQIYGLGTSTVSTLTNPLTYKKSEDDQQISNEEWSDWASKQVINFESDSPIVNEIKKFAEEQQAQSSPVQKTEIETILDFEKRKLSPEDNTIQEQEVVSETKLSPEEKSSRISEIESMLSYDDASFTEKGQRVLIDEARTELQTELKTLKTEQDAVQEQTTSEVPIQPEARVGEEMAQGEPQAEPEVTTEEGKEEIVSEIDTVITTDNKVVPAGKRLFNEPNPETAEISKSYKEKEGISTTEGSKIEQLDTDRSMQIADAYEAMQDAPNDPMVQEAYSKLAEETKKQYDAIKAAGYEVEVWEGEGEPYKNAQEMIDDVRNNKHMYIFSTEKGFGDTPITEQQRQQNAMLQDSGAVDKNGNKLLYNDMFRFVHDFFGHSERGNGFGAIGEENAWDVHARMYSPLARRAMTTETRGQNSWVNFGPQMRNKNGQIIKKGEPGYLTARERAFAPQKMGLLPLEFSNIIESKVEVETKPEITEGAKKLLDALKLKVDKPNVRKQVENAEKAIAKISPKTKIIVHETSEDYVSSKSGRKQNEGGEYDIDNNTIHINLEAANERTVAHEVFHAILLNKGMSNKQAQSITSRMLDAVKKSASPELTKRLDDFSSKYDEPLQSEESIAELFGILASEYETLPRPTQSLVKRWLDKLAKLFGLKPFTDNEIIDMLNVVSAKVESGQEITKQDVKILDGSVSGVINGQVRKQDSALVGFTLKRFPTNPNIKLSENTPLSDFNGKKSNLLESDRMTGAFIADANNNPVFKFFGGIYFPQITGKWWASRTLSKANSIAENMNANRDKDGYIYATPIIMKPNSHMSNQDMFETVWEFMKFDLRSRSSKVTKKLFSEYITKALTLKSVNLTESDLGIKKSDSIEVMISKLDDILIGKEIDNPNYDSTKPESVDNAKKITEDTTLSFEKRKAIIKGILGDPKITEDRKFPTAGSISEVASKFEEEKTKQATKLWDVVMLMRTKGTLSSKVTPKSDEFYHKSYPAEISSDQEIEVFFLDGAYNIDTTYPELTQSSGKVFSWKEYSEKHPSAEMALSQYGRTAKLSKASGDIVAPQSRKQKPEGTPSIADVRAKAKELGVSEQDVYIALRNIGYSDAEISTEAKARMDKAINDAKDKYELSVKKRGNKHKDGVESALNDLKKSDWYSNADDTARENAVREIESFFGEKIKKAPSVAKTLGNKKDKVTVDEMAALKSQIRLEARAARDARIDQNKKREKLATSINEILMKYDKNATIRNKKFKAINNRINKTNLDNEVSVEKLLNYIENTFRDAEYGLKLSIAKKNSTSIRKEIKRKRKDPVLLATAKNFLLIDPSLVSDIDAYLEMSNKIANGLKPTSITDTKTDVSSGFNVSDVDAYVENELEIQDKILAEALDKQIDQITELEIKAKQEMEKRNIQKVFDYYSLLAKQMLKNNEDPFTGEDIDIDAETKTLISKLINIDPLSITKDDAIKAIEAINNFLVNQSTSNVQSIVAKFEAVEDARKELDRGTKSRDLKLYFSKGAGRVISSYFTGLPLIFEKIFGKTPGLRIMRAMGLTDIIQGKSKAIKTLQGILNSYNNVFSKTEPNGQKFNTSYNIAERGLIAFMKRHIPGSEQVDFKTRKKLIKQSIERLKLDGDKDQVKKAEIYEEVYNKTLKGVNNIKELESKADGTNLKAVDWWTNEWSKHYDQLSVVNREVYNEILDKDNNYTPDVFSSMGDVKVDLDRSSFFNSSNYVNKKKTGSLIQSTRPSNLPEGRYVNLDFDFNNANALLGALQDINTASSVMKLDGFLKSDEFKKLIKSNDDRKLLVDRINTYINDMKGANMYSYDELKNVSKAINFVSSVGVSKALGGGAQVLKQTMPVALNTMINAGGINLLATLNKDYTAWLDNVGSGVSIRGIESTAEIDRLNSLIEKAADSKFEEATKLIKKANDLWLNIFLKHPDVWIAKSSFQAYYLQSLKRQGLEYKNIDWSTHEANQEAVDYAQNQVDRQQNFSDVALQGKLFTDKNQVLQLVRKMVFPFASFRMNQKSRMYSDFINLWRGDSSRQDRIDSVRSLGGLAVEQAAFLAIGALIKSIIVSLAYSFIGVDEDEEDREKRIDGYIKGAKTNAILDFASPIPHTDFLITGGYNKLVDVLSDEKIPEEERGYLYDEEGRPREVLNDLGTMGIAAKEIDALLEMSRMAYDGEYTTEFFGRKKDKKIWDKENMIIPAVFQALYVTGALPKDFSDFAKYTTKAMKNRRTK